MAYIFCTYPYAARCTCLLFAAVAPQVDECEELRRKTCALHNLITYYLGSDVYEIVNFFLLI